ncbi:MAG: type II secretion system protein [Phycisphaerae bacterium]
MTARSRAAFTLIELLVVIAIIALLVAILVPSLQAARDLAKRMPCAANLRSMGLGVQTYTQESQEVLPPRDFFGGASVMSASMLLWGDKIVQYFDQSARPPKAGERGDLASSVGCQPASGNYSVSLGCNPNVKYSRSMQCVAQKNANAYHYGWVYSTWNGKCTGWRITSPALPPKKLSDFRPMDYCVIVEPSCQFTVPQYGALFGDFPAFCAEQDRYVNFVIANAPHRKTFNGLMLDGHVTNFTTDFLGKWYATSIANNCAQYPFNVPQ